MPTTTTLRRGDQHEGGTYVGLSAAGVEWVSRRGAAEFQQMSERFDLREGKAAPAPVRRRKLTRCSEQVISLAGDNAAAGAEAGVDYCASARIGATVIEATPEFFSDLAAELRSVAAEWAAGSRTVAEAAQVDVDWRFEEAANKRVAVSLRRWAAKAEKAAR